MRRYKMIGIRQAFNSDTPFNKITLYVYISLLLYSKALEIVYC